MGTGERYPHLVRNLEAKYKVRFKVEGKEVAAAEFSGLPAVSRVEKVEDGFVLYTGNDSATLQELLRFADVQKFRLRDIRTEIPNI